MWYICIIIIWIVNFYFNIFTDTCWDCFFGTKSAGEVQIRRHHQLERLLCHLRTSLLSEPRLWDNKAPPYDLINQGKNQSERPRTTWYQCHKCKQSGSFPGLSDVWIVCKQEFSMKTFMVLFITIQKQNFYFDLWILNAVTYYINSLLLNCEPLKAYIKKSSFEVYYFKCFDSFWLLCRTGINCCWNNSYM